MSHNDTKILTTPYPRPDAYGSLAMPVYHTAAFEFPSAKAMENAFMGRSMDHSYSRISNPTVQYLERRVQLLTGALSVTALNTGMAAISYALMGVASQGSNVIISPWLFGNTVSLLRDTLGAFGVEMRMADLTDLADVESKMDEHTCAIFFEIITNPQLIVADIRALAEVAHRHHVAVIADTTIVPFTVFRAADFGVDIEVVSSTKYISGGATSLGGLLIDYGHFDWRQGCSTVLAQRARKTGGRVAFTARVKTELVTNLGALMSPHAAYMETLGLETLDLRFRQQADTACYLANELTHAEGVRAVGYPALASHPQYELARRQFGGRPGAMFTIDLADKAACYRFIDGLQIIRRATNLFDNRSLAIHPASTIFGPFTEQQRQAMGVHQTTVRLSIGLEAPSDLLADIRHALT